MSNAFTRNLTPLNQTPQKEKAREDQVANNAGGYVFSVGSKARLERFLALGVDKGTYYVGERDLFKDNHQFLIEQIKNDGVGYVNAVREFSQSGRAYRNSPAIFALALVFAHGSNEAKVVAQDAVPHVARTATMLYEFCEYLDKLGGWGRAKTRALKMWYTSKSNEEIAYQAVKYRQRNGWTHRDVLRLAHPQGLDSQVVNFILGKGLESTEPAPEIFYGFEAAQGAGTIQELLNVLDDAPSLPWEAVPTQFHKSPELWKKLFYNGQLRGQALVRNITRLARNGAFNDMVFTKDFCDKLVDADMIAKTRLHPIQYLLALTTYTEGQVPRDAARGGFGYYGRRVKDWTENPMVRDALNVGFYAAFKALEPANKRTLIGLDVSGSMTALAMGIDLQCNVVGAAMAMSVARSEPYYNIMAFDNGIRDLAVTPNMDLSMMKTKVTNINGGGTDCSLPMQWAWKNNVDVDTFVVMTDNETWAGRQHPFEALREYRQKRGHDAKLVVLAMTATDFTIADPRDPGMLDICGVDSNVPNLVANFSAGR